MKNLKSILLATAVMAALATGCKNANEQAADSQDESSMQEESASIGMEQDSMQTMTDSTTAPASGGAVGTGQQGTSGQDAGTQSGTAQPSDATGTGAGNSGSSGNSTGK